MTLFLLIDSSGSMNTNGNMGKVNGAIEEMIPLLRDVSDEQSDAEIKLAVLEFSSGCTWVTGQNGPVSLDDYEWNDMAAGGLTDMGAAFRELDQKLSRNAFMNNAAGNYAPVIILLTDGEPTDDYRSGLAMLQHNNWFRHAVRVAISVDSGADDVLAEFTGSVETVLRYNSEKSDLKKLLTRLAVVSSTIQSHSQVVEIVDKNEKADGKKDDKEPGTKTAEDIVDTIRKEEEERKKAEQAQKEAEKKAKKDGKKDDFTDVWSVEW
jgi:uncharacterized protein YegL